MEDAVAELAENPELAETYPPIRVFESNGDIFTLDNRRLYVFQQAGIPINTVPATEAEIENEAFKFTTNNNGTKIRVR